MINYKYSGSPAILSRWHKLVLLMWKFSGLVIMTNYNRNNNNKNILQRKVNINSPFTQTNWIQKVKRPI